jgi:hypothetical protein
VSDFNINPALLRVLSLEKCHCSMEFSDMAELQ